MKLKIVIIDDEQDAVDKLKRIINEFCNEATVVGEANIIDNGFEVIYEKKPDLVLLDIDMPRGDGFDLIERFPRRTFDIIMITGYPKFKDKAIEYETFGFINKPIDIEKLQKMIKDVSEFRKQNPEKIYWKFPKL